MYIEGAEFQGADWVIPLLVDIASKNGVLLLNIAPLADGSIHPEQQKTLRETGQWLATNGAAIFGTRPWKTHYQGDAPNFYPKGQEVAHSGFAEFGADDFRFTRSKDGRTLYVIAMGRPTGDVVIESLPVSELEPGAVATCLGTEKTMALQRNADGNTLIPAALTGNTTNPTPGPVVYKITCLRSESK